MLTGTIAYADTSIQIDTKEYELWTQSPTITTGITSNDIHIYKAMKQGLLKLLPLSKIGSNYYLAICENRVTDGGYNGKTKTIYFTFYTLYVTGDGKFVVLSSQTPYNEYRWDGGFCLADISGKIDSAYYNNKGYEVPYYIINPKEKYTNTNYTEYDDYFFVTSAGKLYKMSENAEYGTQGYPYIKNKILYRGQDRYKDGSRYPYYFTADDLRASNSQPMLFKNGTVSYGTAIRVALNDMTSDNGYTFYSEGFTSNVSLLSSISNWGVKLPTNKFPDGRYVKGSWTSIGDSLYELWYNIYNPDGTLRATGPTGYSGYFSSVFVSYEIYAWAMNDSKFVVCLSPLNKSLLKEYYRVAVVEETADGEVVDKVEIGEKSIIPPEDSDTEVVQNKIDFGESDLPLGYNIKDNVIDSGKLDTMLREQVNSVRLNDIVILCKEGYQSGEQNTGITLNSYSEYDESIGSSFVRLYTNGQNFGWYCNNPDDLTPGTYPKIITIDDKTIYVTFKVVRPPTNEGSTMVVF